MKSGGNVSVFAAFMHMAAMWGAAMAFGGEAPGGGWGEASGGGVGGGLERDAAFLVRHAPLQDLPLPGEFVTNNCILAAAARASAPEAYPDEIYLDYVLPYSVIREERDDWRGEFAARFRPLVAGSTNAYDAAVTLDRTIWDVLGVHYDKRRDKARQSPRHSMRIGMASCTGISIILVDACRAVGIPARLVGCCWTTIPGNHSWVEVWSQGRWRLVASGECEREDDIWFLPLASEADVTRPSRRIYACRWSSSPEGTHFWRTWDWPQGESDVPADDVTMRYVAPLRFAVVASEETLRLPEWRAVADALAEKHAAEAHTEIVAAFPTNCLERLRSLRPRFVAFLMRHDEFDNSTLVALKRMMRDIDADPYEDAIWGIVTGPDAATAMRIASSRSPRRIDSALATTGMGADAADGPVTVVSDAFPKGEWWAKSAEGNIERHSETGSLHSVFAGAWRDIDPQLVLTSSHATEHNLEMPFSLGNIVATNGIFAAAPEVAWTGEYAPLAAPSREKVWLAPGNCLIANHADEHDMVMTALSFGKANQFAGYIKPTWFGFAGWTTWRYFGSLGYPLAASHSAASLLIARKLAGSSFADEQERDGFLWDFDGTVFYGDPMQRVYMKCAFEHPAFGDADAEVIFFPYSRERPRFESVPEGLHVFEADDFAIVER